MAVRKSSPPVNRRTVPLADPRRVEAPSIGEYLIRRLQDYGIEHVFGIPGDFVLQFYAMLSESPIDPVVGCTREDNAGIRR